MRSSEFLTEKPVQSTWISSITYNRANKILTMGLSNGKNYSIPGISRRTFEHWTNVRSKGRYFHDFIKDKYQVKRI